MKRRQLLSLTGSLLATLGLSQLELKQRAIFYRSVLAENTPRKRALLVGVNNYPDTRWIPLEGAVNDVKLQQELLIHRFGFQSDQILLLTDHEATRENILQAFEEHLIKWAQPGDVVVFHFSGHGSQVFDPDQIFQDGQVSTIVPVDSILPPGYPNKGGKVNDITGHTLWLLMQAINTENVTFILDSCHSGGARKGILTVRSRPGNRELNRTENSNIQLLASPQEQEYQKQLMSRLNLTASDLATERKKGVPKGIMLAAARTDQAAIDASFGDTAAGIFTYILTRYLWQQTGGESVSQVMVSATATTDRILREYFPTAGLLQQPEFNTREGSNNSQQAVYFLLEAFGRGAILTLVDGEGKERGQVQIESRQELTAKGKLMQTRDNIASGTLLQERSRAIPSDLTLRIRLDASLGQEQAAAKQALQGIKSIEAVSSDETDIHYILGRVTPAYYQQLQKLQVTPLPEIGSLALFSLAADLIPGSAGISGESVTDGVKRLQGKLKSLLAARLVKLTLNATSARLSVAAAMETVDGGQLVAESFTVRGAKSGSFSQNRGVRGLTSNAQKIKQGTQVQFLVQNNELVPLYITVLLISVDGTLCVLSPLLGTGDNSPVTPGQTIQIPDPNRGELYKFKVAGESGRAEALVIATTTPLTKAVDLLQVLAAERGDNLRGTPVDLTQPDEAIFSLLDDLDGGSRRSGTVSTSGVRQIDTRQMAAMSITFEVIGISNN
ncbi:MAG: DUF4384 domain-containing protein [Microcystis aeruginosa G13-05]|nr:DUF4384 domain-containing protein [Microcystis aeruginosa G13-05]